ncbi:MAG: BTAD domain-containing putative transcriptional regulator [Gaiellaceae bacterium]
MFRLLGPLEIRVGDRPVRLGGVRQRSLLALLLLRPNEVVSRDRLIEELWHDHAPESAANALAALVARLRRVLPPDTLVTRSGGYEAQVELEAIDLFRFERLHEEGRRALAAGEPAAAAEQLRAALSLWRGPPLADLAYEPFAGPVLLRLEELRLAVLELRVDSDLAIGRHGELVGELQSLVLEHPLRERFRAQLMLALYASGRQAEALEAYRDAHAFLTGELGVDPSPALQELHQAILRHDESIQPREGAASETGGPPRADDAAPSWERHPVTVLAAAAGGSSSDARLAPDEARALLGECVTMMRVAVEELGGTVVDSVDGESVRASFGLPVAHGDDPERAALAALRILDMVAAYARDVEAAWGIAGFTVSVGIESGWTDDEAAAEVHAEAERLRSGAAPGTALLGTAAARRLGRRMVVEPAGDAWRLVAPPPDTPTTAAPSLGRQEELARLAAELDHTVSGRGRIVALTGPPGIGKSRLVADLRALAAGRATWLEGHCLSYGGLTPQPFTEILLSWLAAEVGTPEIALRTRARARLGALLGDELDDVLAPLGRLLGLQREQVGVTAERVAAAYVRWLEALAAEGPLVVVLEDAHWADPPTRDLAEAVFALTDRAGVGVVLTEEPGDAAGTPGLRLRALEAFPHRTAEVALGPLPDDAASELLADMVGDDLEAGELEGLVREAEGNPLYLEELARALVEGSLEARGRTWTISLRSPELLPPTLENLLVARIDRLAAGPRALAQTAAALGRTFPVPVLTHLAGESADDDLAALFRTEIVREVRRHPDFECTFTHGLLQQAALATLTPVARRDRYARVAAGFEEVYGASLDDHRERLAHYHAQSGNLPRALEYAERARRRG